MSNQQRVASKKGKKKTKNYTIDCSKPIADGIMVASDLEAYFKEHIKVDNKLGMLGEKVVVQSDANKVTVRAQQPFSKRYLKYLTKKFLKKKELREYLRVVASSTHNYEVRYFEVGDESDAE
eukprot:GILI01029761.1.p1 GENE.GILI01029761.1~~GILI01029761.1.p1  ORF type:complete len:122 (+),score=51.10 GILI01029761.1:37-402(+)